ncbi:MAG: hypothetical protein IJT97_04270 [Bacteroidaceae bacterium]|nr:hypothetical protein [Bacteroidaceae bacterium]
MKRLIFTCACLLITIGMAAQWPNFGRQQFSPEKFRENMENFITKEAGLTANEQQKFYPMLNEMLSAQRKLMAQEREVMKSGQKAKTEAEYEQIVKKTTELQVENRKIEQTYYKKFAKVLTWEKIYKVRMALTKFNMHALRNFSPQNKDPWKKGWHGKRPGNH